MKGGIYSYQKCKKCGASFKYDGNRSGLFCVEHPDQSASGDYVVRFGREVRRRFSVFEKAERFLYGLRYEVDRGTFDIRDYQADNPLSFTKLSEQWLLVKKEEVKPGSYRNLERYILNASWFWKDTNVKKIGFAEIEDFLLSQKVSQKTRSNVRSCLHTFWTWLLHRKVITPAQFPEFPVVKFKLGYRKIVDKATQTAIVDEVYRLTYSQNPKIWLGIKWLCTYVSIRPGELLKVKEQDVNSKMGFFIIKHSKEGSEKYVPMLDIDKQLVNALPVGNPHLPFFRHVKGVSGCRSGQPFGQKYLYKWWKRACESLGIEGLDLYGGTRHSSVTALKSYISPEQIKSGTMHTTNKAFERYFQRNNQDAIDVYTLAELGHERDTVRDTSKIITYRN